MTKTTKKVISVVLSVLMVLCSVPMIAFASDTGTLTISADTTADGVDINPDVAFSYEVVIGNELYNGTAAGDDGSEYDIVDGIVTIPYNVSATIADIPAGTAYAVKRLAYDNAKYALVDESAVAVGKVAAGTYFVTETGKDKKEITEAEFNAATDNGANMSVTIYRDSDGNEAEMALLNAGNSYSSITHSVTNKDFYYTAGTLESFTVNVSVNYTNVTEKKVFGRVVGYTANGSYTFTSDVIDAVSGSLGEYNTGKQGARDSAANKVQNELHNYVRNCMSVLEAQGKGTAFDLPSFTYAEGTSETQTAAVYAFTELTGTNYDYSVVYGQPDVVETFGVNLTPAPTGTFQINFALDGTVPTGYDGAVFEIKDLEGNVLVEGEDYTLEKSAVDLSGVTNNILNWGVTVYKFSGLKAGIYTIEQTETANGYKRDINVYTFAVARRDGAVSGDALAVSAINGGVPGLYNADKSINIFGAIKVKLYIFMNESFSLKFNVKDQNKEPVEGAEFMMIERDGLVKLVGQLVKLGVDNIGNLDLNNIISSIGNLDFSNIDANTVLQILLTVLDLLPTIEDGTTLTIPAVLTAASNAEGVVEFNNSSNMMNVLDTIAKLGSAVDAESLAETIKNLVGSSVPEEYLNVLVNLAKYVGILDVHSGIPAATYVLMETKAPEGYEKTAIAYTITVGDQGNATTQAGLILPIIADVINDRFGYDIYELLVNEEQFNNASAAVKEAFGTFDNYMNIVVDVIETFVKDDIAGITVEQIEEFRNTVNNAYEQYDDFSAAIAEGIKQLNSSIKDEFTEDWTYTNQRYFLDVAVGAVNCAGDVVADAPISVKDADGNDCEIVNGVATLPYGTYTFTAENTETLVLADGEAVKELVINDHNATYEVSYTYHDLALKVIDDAVAPKCLETGLTEGSHCACGAVIVPQQEVEALGHSFTNYISDENETCLADGTKTAVCDRCDVTDTLPNEDSALGHSFTNYISDGNADCTNDGTKTATCDRCDATNTLIDVGSALGHDPVIDEEVAPDCLNTGLTAGVHCGRCGDVLTAQEVVDALGHDVVVDEAVAPTCTQTGLTEGSHCGRCGDVLVAQQVVDALGHNYVATVTAPTCLEGGYTTYVCSACGDAYVADATAALGHAWGEWKVTTAPQIGVEGEETRVCSGCGAKETRVVDALVAISLCYINTLRIDAEDMVDIGAMSPNQKAELSEKLAAYKAELAALEARGLIVRNEYGVYISTTVAEGSAEANQLMAAASALENNMNKIRSSFIYKLLLLVMRILRLISAVAG